VSIINQDKVNGLTEEYNKITGDEPVNNAERYNLIISYKELPCKLGN
jgi:hypothetical protein